MILDSDHLLGSTFAVGPKAPARFRRAGAEAVGFAIGAEVAVTGGRHRGRAGLVITINPADLEVGVAFGETLAIAPTWFRPTELEPQTPPERPALRRSRSTRGTRAKAPGG